MHVTFTFFGKFRPMVLQGESREDVIALAHKAIKDCEPDYIRFVESSLASMYEKPSNYSAMSYTDYAFGSVSLSSNEYDPWLESLYPTMNPKPGLDYSMHNGKQAFIKAEERLGYETRIYSMIFVHEEKLFSADSIMKRLIEASKKSYSPPIIL